MHRHIGSSSSSPASFFESATIAGGCVFGAGPDTKGETVIFYAFEPEVYLLTHGNKAAPYFYRRNTAYFQMPFELVEIAAIYKDIRDGKKLENKAVMLAAKAGHRKSIISILLHDIHPGKYGCEKGLETAKQEFGFTGTIEQVREQLGAIRARDKDAVGPIEELIGDELVPGVFCDVEGTLLDDAGKVDDVLLSILKNEAKAKSVTLWTGGDPEKISGRLLHAGIKQFPLVSKHDFRGCNVEIVYDDLPQEEFKKQYGIRTKAYLKA